MQVKRQLCGIDSLSSPLCDMMFLVTWEKTVYEGLQVGLWGIVFIMLTDARRPSPLWAASSLAEDSGAYKSRE